MSRWFPLGLLLIVSIALALRLPQLDRRPMHNDEGVNAIKFRELWTRNAYRYDPNEHHGPTLQYSTVPVAALSGGGDFVQFSEITYRLVPLIFGVGLILLLPLLRDGLGRFEVLSAAALTALSPAMVFFSRYYIHEMLLVFFSMLLIVGVWRYFKAPKAGWAILSGGALGMMHATKETFVFALIAGAMALTATWAWNRWIDRQSPSPVLRVTGRHVVLALLTAMIVSITLFSSFFTNASGPLDSLRTYSPWLNRAGGDSPHVHPWYEYLRRLLFFHYPGGPYWSEGLILALAAIGGYGALAGRVGSGCSLVLLRGLTFYTLLLTAIYTVIPYKTPWCLLGFWHPTIVLAGVGVSAFLRSRPVWLRTLVGGALVAGGTHLGGQAWRASYPLGASPYNPYVYAQTSPDILTLVKRIEALATASPDGHKTVVKVMSPQNDYWPLPWYLRRFERVGWWSRIPPEPFAPVMIVSSQFEAAFDERQDKTHLMAGYFQLRPQVFLELYVELDLWRAYVQTLPREAD